MDQERFYTSPMVFQQPFMVPNQSIIYPSQQVFEVPINNYLLIPNGNPQMNQQVQQLEAPSRVPMQLQPRVQQQQLAPQYTQQLQHQPPQQPQHQPQQLPQAPQLQHQHQAAHGKQARSRQASAASTTLYANFNERLASLLPAPPLAKCADRPNVNFSINQKRAKRKSKFTKKQDEMIIALKKSGKNWVEIAEITKVGSYLAARNRYQVIVGQQGNNNSSSWDANDRALLKRLLDKHETEKWKFIANELNKATGKTFNYKDCQSAVRQLVLQNPLSFMINEDTINELLKEKKITEKAHDSVKDDDFMPALSYSYEGGEIYY